MADRIDAPAVRPPAVSLLAAAEVRDDLDRIEDASFLSFGCGGFGVRATCSNDAVDSGVQSGCAPVKSSVFIVEAGIQVSAAGSDVAAVRAAAAAKLDSVLSAAIARELAEGALTAGVNDAAIFNHPSFRGATDLNSGGAVSTRTGLARLEDYLADLLDGPVGAIHATRGAATVMPEKARNGNIITTSIGTVVIPDAGYRGRSPAGAAAAAGEAWVYATSLPLIRRGPVDVLDAVNRNDNTLTVKAFRPVQVMFECGAAGVRITLA